MGAHCPGSPHHTPPPSPPPPCFSQQCFPLCAGAWTERFSLHVATGELRTATVLRRAERAEYVFTVTASDRGAVPRSTSAIVRVQVPSAQAPPVPARQLLLSLYHPPLTCLLEDTIQLLGSLSPHPPAPSSLGTLCSCSAVDPALKSMWRTWDGKGWVRLPLCIFSFPKWPIAVLPSPALDSQPCPRYPGAGKTSEVPCSGSFTLPSIY